MEMFEGTVHLLWYTLQIIIVVWAQYVNTIIIIINFL